MATDHSPDDLDRAVRDAQAALLRVASNRQWWNPRDLREQARNGWTGDVMMYALTDLVNRGELELGKDLRVRIADEATVAAS